MTEQATDNRPERDILTVSGLNRMARALLEDCFPLVSVEGEISNLATPASGHWYLTLKDERAQIRCAMFRNRNQGVRFRPANGMQVLVRGRLSLYEARGDYQLILDSLEEAGAGALQRAFEELKARLQARGLFASERKQALPARCRHIAVITSPTGAVLQDILTVLQRRFPAMRVTVLPVPVQGAEAPDAIIRALETANRRASELGFDAIIVARGGGSLEDLQAFNEERVAMAIVDSTLPVVSAVGHETDFSIADFVADVRAPTPSAAAELLSPDQQRHIQALQQQQQRLQRGIQQLISQHARQLRQLIQRLRHPGRRLQEQSQYLDGLESRLHRGISARLERQGNRLAQQRSRLLLQSPGHRLRQQKQRNSDLLLRLQLSVKRQLDRKAQALRQSGRNLETVSPLRTLQRGYSITQGPDGNVVRHQQDLQAGDRIRTRLQDGEVLSIVEKTLATET